LASLFVPSLGSNHTAIVLSAAVDTNPMSSSSQLIERTFALCQLKT
jgi:hypothetical protein